MPKKILYAAAAVIAAAFYFFSADYLLSVSLKALSAVAGTSVNEKVLYVRGDFNARTCGEFFKKTAELKNSVTLFMPEFFSRQPGDFMEGEDFNGLEKASEKYRDFAFMFAESDNFIPVVFNAAGAVLAGKEDISQYVYFNRSKYQGKAADFIAPEAVNKRLWLSARNAGFYGDFASAPFKIPALYSVDGGLLISAPVEALRKYYKLPKSRILIEDGKLAVGDITGAALITGGEMAIPVYAGEPETITLEKFMNMPVQEADSRIIIAADKNTPLNSVSGMGAAVSMMIDRGKITYKRLFNYIAALLVALLAAGAYLRFGAGAGFPFFIFIQLAGAAAVYWLYMSGIYADYPAVTFANVAAFVTIYGFKAGSKKRDVEKRKGLLRQAMPDSAAERFIKKNSDVKMKNSWLKADAVYFVFSTADNDPAALKKDFERIQSVISGNFPESMASASGSGEIAFLIFGENDRKKIVETLNSAREKVTSAEFNIIISTTEVLVFERGGELAFLEKDSENRRRAYALPVKKYMLVAEKEIQRYVNITKFQQIPGYEKSGFFNLAGLRGEA